MDRLKTSYHFIILYLAIIEIGTTTRSFWRKDFSLKRPMRYLFKKMLNQQ